jgi:CRISPR/Cas system-associated exonuclease Cas4 (RecB family)
MTMFKPRSSRMGHYMSCPAAMWYDLHHPVESAPWRNKYTSFGTIVHWRIQEMLGCDLAHAEPPCPEDYTEAESMLHAVDAAATNAVEEVNKIYPGLTWLAESELDNGDITGHVDLRCGKILVDFKTASRVPARQQISPAHYWQLLAYAWLTGCTELRILYVNSKAE